MNSFDYNSFKRLRIPTEAEIMATWSGGNTRPVVSIICTAFNHEAYIEDAIRGFLIQHTNFPFEVLVSDDASSDRTVEILRKFQSEYPNIIKCQLHAVNRFSQGDWPLLLLTARAAGEFVAICEGDDYWISPSKLHQQVAALNAAPGVDICIHGALSETNVPVRRFREIGLGFTEPQLIPARRVISGGGGFCATASIMLRASFAQALPEWVARAPVLDLFLQGMASFDKGAIFLPEVMCVYRVSTESSWTRKVNSTYLSDELLARYDAAFTHYDDSTGRKYADEISVLGARAYLSGAISSIRFRRAQDFRSRIERSVALNSSLGALQGVLFRLRRQFRILRFSYLSYWVAVNGSRRIVRVLGLSRRAAGTGANRRRA